MPIQLFMATRIMKFAQSRVLFYVIAFGSITQAALACSAASLGMVDPAVSNHVNMYVVSAQNTDRDHKADE